MDEKPMILSPGINSEGVRDMQNSPRALMANEFYKTATGIKNRAGAFVGFALTDEELNRLTKSPNCRGGELAKAFFKQFSRSTDSESVGSFILVGNELDMFLDLLAGVPVVDGWKRIKEIVNAQKAVPAAEINQRQEGKRW